MSEEKDLTKKEETGLTTFDSNLVKQSQQMAGQTQGNFIPFIPMLEINNKTEKKTIEVNGQEQEVEIPAVKGFNLLTRNEETKEYTRTLIEGDIKGVILKERFMIEKKFKPDSTEVQYKSDEFDGWNEIIKIYNKKNRKEIILEGTYSEIRDAFTSEQTNKDGTIRKVKDYNLYTILYINLDDKGEVYRLRIKMTMDNRWFDYKNEFNRDEPWAGYLTNFNLVKKMFGKVTYWYIEFEKGDMVDLAKQLELQKEINKFFTIMNTTTAQKITSVDAEVVDEEETMDKSVDQIPF